MRGLGVSVWWEGLGDRISCLGLPGGIWWDSVGDEALASSSSKAGWRADGGLVYNTSSGVRSTSSSSSSSSSSTPTTGSRLTLASWLLLKPGLHENISLEADEQSRPSSHGAGRGPTVGFGVQTATSTVGALLLLLSHSSPPPVAAAKLLL